jgi:hypothetical protein
MVAPKIAPLGIMIRRPSPVSMLVWKRSISLITPEFPPTTTPSPTLKGRNTSNITPAARFERLPWNPRPIARPVAPINAAKLAVWTPNRPRHITTATARIAHRAVLAMNLVSVISNLARSSPRRTARRAQPAITQAANMSRNTVSTSGPYFLVTSHAWFTVCSVFAVRFAAASPALFPRPEIVPPVGAAPAGPVSCIEASPFPCVCQAKDSPIARPGVPT